MKKVRFITYLPVMFFVLCIYACTKMDNYKKFIKGGEIRYTGKVDSMIVHSGYNRVKLTMILGSDPSVTKVRVYWNNGTDSAQMDVNKEGNEEDTLNMFINNLTARVYNFVAFTYDNKGHSSVPTYASGSVYGEDYKNSLVNRALKSLQQTPAGGSVIINWSEANKGGIGTVLRYKDSTGNEHKVVVAADQMQTELTGYKENSQLYYQSLYLPDSTAIDTISVAASSIKFPFFERQLDKSKFSAYPLPTDIQDGGYGWYFQYLWDGNDGTPGWATAPGMPQWFTFDLGEKVTLSRFKVWQAPDRLYIAENVKKFEIYGSLNPAPDGSWSGWTKLLTCVSVKPSGLPLGQVTADDIAYAEEGEQYIFPNDTPPVRYIRIKVLETWGEINWVTMSEITFWTHDH